MPCLILYSKPGCHLCEGLQEKLEVILGQLAQPPTLEIRDITTQPEWWQAYEYEIPVLYWQMDASTPPLLIPRASPRVSVAQLQQGLARVSPVFAENIWNHPNLSEHSPAPDFTLLDAQGNAISLSSYQGQWVVLYFYPRDLTPGCTTEACGFRDAYTDLQELNAVVLGISTDDAKSHQKFINKHTLPFVLLTDADGAVATIYESYGPKKFMGRDLVGIYRNTFLISPDGKIAKIYRKVKTEGHAAQVLADLVNLNTRP
jgi:thioredoxin-dependent peroxiredoxin